MCKFLEMIEKKDFSSSQKPEKPPSIFKLLNL